MTPFTLAAEPLSAPLLVPHENDLSAYRWHGVAPCVAAQFEVRFGIPAQDDAETAR